MDIKQSIKEFYNNTVEDEWNRIDGRAEFILTCRFLDRYIKPGDKILDIGGGPGRYSFYLAEKGCDVTLFDLSEGNVDFARKHAIERNMTLNTICGDACFVDELINEQFDNVLLMGPMYHLLEESERVRAINASLKLLKKGGILFISFINMIAGMIYAMKFQPEVVADPAEQVFLDAFLENRSYAGMAFTNAYFAKQGEILPFMNQFPLRKLHLIGQEGIMSPCEGSFTSKPEEITKLWLDISEKVCEREELLSWSEHLMYIGEKV